MDGEIQVKVDHVSFRYSGETVLDDVSLEVKKGDFLGVIGPNGSGKTTLLRLMLGLLRPTQGEIYLFGRSLADFSDWRRIGYVPQKAGAVASTTRFPVTVKETIAMEGASGAAIDRALSAVGMADHRNKLLAELSGGQQQRVFIARALASKPELLILDEPTVGVDVESQSQFYDLLKKLNREMHISLVLVSHDVDVVAHEVKTVACLNKTIVFHGQPHELAHGDFLEKLYGKNVRFVVHGH